MICSLNCQGIRRSSSYICDILKSTSCDIICLQETWTMDSNLEYLFNIHTDYLFTCISGPDHIANIIKGRPYGGVALFYKKSMSNDITHIKSSNRRVCGINLNINNISLIVLSVYMPCASYSSHIFDQDYADCIDYIETIFNKTECNYFFCAGDFNTCFSRLNAHTSSLNDFIERNNLAVTWDNAYCKLSLNHFSCIDHFVIFDCISGNVVVCEAINPSNHTVLYLQFDFNISLNVYSGENVSHKCGYSWHKALPHELSNYSRILNNNLSAINIPNDLLVCTNCKCTNDFHKHAIDFLCHSIICSCMAVSAECVPTARPRAREVIGWTDQVKPERDRSLFWHWFWLETGKPNTGFVYQIMKYTRHQYHYAVRCCKKYQLNIQKNKS